VAAAITPFNFPVMVPMWIYPIALACGNTFVWKPSSHTPGATQLQAELWKQAGLPDGVFNIVYGGREAVSAILEAPRHRRDSSSSARPRSAATSTRPVRGTASASAPTPPPRTRWSSSPTPTWNSPPTAAVAAGYGSAGERCMAQTLVIGVGDGRGSAAAAHEATDRQSQDRPGHGAGRRHGPIYSAEHRASIIDWIDKGVAEGAQLVHDGRPFHLAGYPDGYFLGVTLFDHVTPEMEIYREEIFGPVLGIVRAATYDEALAMINGHQYGKRQPRSSLPTAGRPAASSSRWTCPMIGINVPIPVPAATLSFGGTRGSAFGDLKMRGEDGIRFFTQQKMVTVRWPEPGRREALSLVFPGNR